MNLIGPDQQQHGDQRLDDHWPPPRTGPPPPTRAGLLSPALVRAMALAVVACACGIGVVSLLNGAKRVGEPFPGFLVARNRIVVSIGLSDWSLEKVGRILFAQILDVDGQPVDRAQAIQDVVRAHPVDTVVRYRFRQGADVFEDAVATRQFSGRDFLTLYGTYFAVGACYVLAGLMALWPSAGRAFGTGAFFLFCLTAGLLLLTAGDVYGPYRFTPLYFIAHCLLPAALLQFAGSYPEPIILSPGWRRLVWLLAYAFAAALAGAVLMTFDEPSLFLPLVYTVWLLIANATLLYLARLATAWRSATDRRVRASARRALLAVVVSALAACVIFVVYPALESSVSPILLVAPLAIMPLVTATALRALPRSALPAQTHSLHARLSLLFLGAVETAFLLGVALFWLNQSQQRLLDDVLLNEHQQMAVSAAQLRGPALSPPDLAALTNLAQTVDERRLVASVAAAIVGQEHPVAAQALEDLAAQYRLVKQHLLARRQWVSAVTTGLVLVLIVVGVVQAVVFNLAVQRWLIRPIRRLATATGVIATGDLDHRVAEPSDEFSALAQAINTMAGSLGDIQRRIDAEEDERRQATGAAREIERRRLARELHEGVLQDLTVVKLQIEQSRAVGAAAISTLADTLVAGVVRVITEVRQIVDDLRPADLTIESLVSAIGAHARTLARPRGVAVRLDFAPGIEVPAWAARDVYRITQEAVANAIHHGAARLVAIQLSRHAGEIVLEITDDGSGFDSNERRLESGLVGMRERAAAIGATFTITSAPGQGTMIRLAFVTGHARPLRYRTRDDDGM